MGKPSDKKSKKSDPVCSYSKLKSGNWGVRSTQEIAQGDTVVVTMKSGESREEVVERIVWSGDGVWIAALVGKDNNKAKATQSSDSSESDDDLTSDE